MAAGQGFKDFTTGEVLTAADVDGYLMQGVWVFASAAARDAAVTSPQEGNFAYLKDTNVTTYYTGSAWANLDTTGMVNPMTTTGDTIYSSSGSTPARLGIGSTGQVLTVAGGVPTWATSASGGGMTLLQSLSLSGASVTSSTLSSAYKQFIIYMKGMRITSGNEYVAFRLNTDTGSNYSAQSFFIDNGGANYWTQYATTSARFALTDDESSDLYVGKGILTITRPSDTDYIFWNSNTICLFGTNRLQTVFANGSYNSSAAITSITLFPEASTWTAGTAEIYGVN